MTSIYMSWSTENLISVLKCFGFEVIYDVVWNYILHSVFFTFLIASIMNVVYIRQLKLGCGRTIAVCENAMAMASSDNGFISKEYL